MVYIIRYTILYCRVIARAFLLSFFSPSPANDFLLVLVFFFFNYTYYIIMAVTCYRLCVLKYTIKNALGKPIPECYVAIIKTLAGDDDVVRPCNTRIATKNKIKKKNIRRKKNNTKRIRFAIYDVCSTIVLVIIRHSDNK